MNERSIFLDALALTDPDQQKQFLDQACGDNQQLRSQVEELLVSHDQASGFLEEPPVGLGATIAGAASHTPADADQTSSLGFLGASDKPGCLGTLFQYEIVEVVGRGGMGLVLRAYDTKLNRVVAIKVMVPELAANPMAVKRFLREARAAAAVSHDHVVTIHAIEEDCQPPFIVMEYVDGQSLQQKIDVVGALSVAEILRISSQTAQGLSAAHQQGLVHRDIKPANILLENGIERVKITDFGLARATDDVRVTQTGQIAGTPQYMSPEQAEGLQLDARSDLFSLGSVIYTMCTGRAPFRADSAVAMLRRVAEHDPKSIHEINSEIPVWLEEIVFKLLAKRPEQRFQSAEEVSELFHGHLAHLQQPASAPLPPRVGPLLPSSVADPLDHTEPLSLNTQKRLTFVRNVLAIFGCLSLLWFFSSRAMPYYGANSLGFTGIPKVFSLLTGVLALFGAWQVMHRRSYGWALIGNLALLAPVNIMQMFGLFFTIWSSTQLWRDDVRKAFASESAKPIAARPPVASDPAAHWLRRVPIPAYLALGLFAMVFVAAMIEWFGGHAVSSRGNGVLFYLLGTAFVLLWGVCALAAQVIQGPNRITSALPPTRMHLVSFFSVVILVTGGLIWQWAELGNKTDRELLLGFFFKHGTITLTVDDPDIEIQFNDQRVDVPADGRVVVNAEWPGSYTLTVKRRDGSVNRSEFLIHGGMSAGFGSGVFLDAERIIIAGPIRGRIDPETADLATSRAGQRAAYPAMHLERRLQGHTATVTAVDISSDGHYALSASGWPDGDGTLRLWDIATAREIHQFEGHEGPIVRAYFSPRGDRIIAGGTKHDAFVYDVQSRERIASFRGIRSPFRHALALLPDGKHALVGEGVGSVHMMDIETEQIVDTFKQPDDRVMAIAVSPDGTRALATSGDEVYVWNLENREFVGRFRQHSELVQSVAFAHDAARAVTASLDGTVRMWDVETQEQIHVFRGHSDGVLCAQFAPGDSLIFSAGHDHTIRTWDVDTGKQLLETKDPGRSVWSIAITPNGRYVLGAGGQKSANDDFRVMDFDIRVWRVPEHRLPEPAAPQPESTASMADRLGMKFVRIPNGQFWMGASENLPNMPLPNENWFFADFVPDRREAEVPRHRVTISQSLEMSVHEVTVGQFRQFVEASGYQSTAEQDGFGYGWQYGQWVDDAHYSWRNPGFEQSDEHPVCNVSWDDASAFCRWLSEQEGLTYRLPTEAEWEYACRAGTTTLFFSGDEPESLQGVANLADATLRNEQPSISWAVDWSDGFASMAPVGSFKPNALGLYDMHGNAWEWCQDLYDDQWYADSPPLDPLRQGSGRRVFRGGGFDNWPGFLRSADRYSSHSDELTTDWAGFRVVRTLAVVPEQAEGE